MNDRIQFDGTELDEIVMSDVTFHIERMGFHSWWLGVDGRSDVGPDKRRLDMWFSLMDEPVLEWEAMPAEISREPLAWFCHATWRDSHGCTHHCEIDKRHAHHRCECGARKAGKR